MTDGSDFISLPSVIFMCRFIVQRGDVYELWIRLKVLVGLDSSDVAAFLSYSIRYDHRVELFDKGTLQTR